LRFGHCHRSSLSLRPFHARFALAVFGRYRGGVLADGTNAARVQNGLPSLQVSPLLERVAQEKVNDMVANNYFAHTSPAGVTPWHWFETVGYSFTYAGENLAVDFSDSQDVTNAWLNSPEHRANILDTNFTQVGIAIATGTFEGQQAVFVAEEFGAPSPVAAAEPSAAPIVAVPKIVPAAKPAPTVIAVSGSQTSSSEQSFVAVEGASAEAASVAAPATGSAPAATAAVPAAAPQLEPQTNVVQQVAANPRSAVNSIYVFMAVLFAVALMLNIFVKMRVQHPNIIMSGLIAISLAGIFIVMNQYLFLSVVVKSFFGKKTQALLYTWQRLRWILGSVERHLKNVVDIAQLVRKAETGSELRFAHVPHDRLVPLELFKKIKFEAAFPTAEGDLLDEAVRLFPGQSAFFREERLDVL
jgi:hypothetical protein